MDLDIFERREELARKQSLRERSRRQDSSPGAQEEKLQQMLYKLEESNRARVEHVNARLDANAARRSACSPATCRARASRARTRISSSCTGVTRNNVLPARATAAVARGKCTSRDGGGGVGVGVGVGGGVGGGDGGFRARRGAGNTRWEALRALRSVPREALGGPARPPPRQERRGHARGCSWRVFARGTVPA